MMHELDGKMVMPADVLAQAEELTPGPYTYEENGKVRSAALGMVRIDIDERLVFVEPINPVVEVAKDDMVLGIVKDLRKSIALISIMKVAGSGRSTLGTREGTIHVSKVSTDYTEDLNDEFQLQDIVRARVVKMGHPLQLSTHEEDMGVIWSKCVRCFGPLKLKGGRLFCSDCDRYYRRKVALDYGSGNEIPENDDPWT